MAKCRLHKRDRCAAIQCVAGVGVPVSQCAEAAAEIPASAAACLTMRLTCTGVRCPPLFDRNTGSFSGVAAKRGQLSPDPWSKQHDPGVAAFALVLQAQR
jgi:hypothetical protein